jgi:hypothetical protein
MLSLDLDFVASATAAARTHMQPSADSTPARQLVDMA